jgi:inner membrane protein
VDNLTHTLAGWALAQAGLRHRAPRATATLILGANLPDLDVLSYVVGSNTDALGFRRGWTHGVLAMVVLPLVLTAVMGLFRGPGTGVRGPVLDRRLLVVAAIGVWSHPLLDLVNTYGVRLLMPFSGRWFYGDALFIVDPWLMLLLGAGILGARLARGGRPARVALLVAAGYAVAMGGAGRLAARRAERAAGGGALRTLASPTFAVPTRWRILRELPEGYETGRLTLGGGPYRPVNRYRHDPGAAAVQSAVTQPAARRFLGWSRFPYFQPEAGGLRIVDLRYGTPESPGWASVLLPGSGALRGTRQ